MYQNLHLWVRRDQQLRTRSEAPAPMSYAVRDSRQTLSSQTLGIDQTKAPFRIVQAGGLAWDRAI
jgi:hypothetical protein